MSLFATHKALGRLLESMQELQDSVADLQRARRKLDLEFTELYDKVSHQMSRMAKRYAHREKAEELPPEEEVIGETVLGSDAVSQSILRRRAGGGR